MKTIALTLAASFAFVAAHAQETPPAGETKPAEPAPAETTPAKKKSFSYAAPKSAGAKTRVDGDGASRGGAPKKNFTYAAGKTGDSKTRVDGDGASRGDADQMQLPSLHVLTPEHAALTASESPSLFWFQSGPTDVAFELTVTDPKKPKPLLKVGSPKAGPAGIRRISLAKQNVKLSPDISYQWTIALIPDPKNRSLDVISRGGIKRVEPAKELAAEVEKSTSPGDKAAAYASAGIWYDALEALTDEIDKTKDKGLRAQRAELLDQVGLKAAAKFEQR